MRLPPPPPNTTPGANPFAGLPTIFTVLAKLGLELTRQDGILPTYTVERIKAPSHQLVHVLRRGVWQKPEVGFWEVGWLISSVGSGEALSRSETIIQINAPYRYVHTSLVVWD